MFLLISNTLNEYLLMEPEIELCSSWHATAKECFENYTQTNLATWGALNNKKFPEQLLYLEQEYKVLNAYERVNGSFEKIRKPAVREDFPEYYL